MSRCCHPSPNANGVRALTSDPMQNFEPGQDQFCRHQTNHTDHTQPYSVPAAPSIYSSPPTRHTYQIDPLQPRCDKGSSVRLKHERSVADCIPTALSTRCKQDASVSICVHIDLVGYAPKFRFRVPITFALCTPLINQFKKSSNILFISKMHGHGKVRPLIFLIVLGHSFPQAIVIVKK